MNALQTMAAPGQVEWNALIGGAENLLAERVAPGVTRLSERVLSPESRSYFYFVEGSYTDCLIDGGWGFCRTLEGLGSTPGKAVIAIATHSHYDHIGLLHLARRRLGHAAESAVFASPDPVATQALPFLANLPVLSGGECIQAESIRQSPCPLDAVIADGDVLDIGGRRLRLFHTPGHSPGSISVLDETTGVLFCGDTVHDGHIYDDIPGAAPAILARSQQRLADLDFLQACAGHGAVLSRTAFLSRVAAYHRRF